MKIFLASILVLVVAIGYSFIDWFDPGEVVGQRVLITGASTGIGEQISYHYARLGASIVITARREQQLQEVIARCRQVGTPDGTYNYVVADMSDMKSTQYVIQEAVRHLGGIDVLALNHKGDVPLGKWSGSHSNLTGLDTMMDINFRSFVHLTSHAMSYLEESQGRLVAVSSMLGRMTGPFITPYSTSKYALEGFFSSLRVELAIARSPVSVSVCPIGITDTDSAMAILRRLGIYDHVSAIIASPQDVALAIVKGATLRERDVFYPPFLGPAWTAFHALFPKLSDMLSIQVWSGKQDYSH